MKIVYLIFVLVAACCGAETVTTRWDEAAMAGTNLYVNYNIDETCGDLAISGNLTIWKLCVGPFTIDQETGEVEFDEGYTNGLTEASCEFWEAIFKAYPEAVRRIVEKEGRGMSYEPVRKHSTFSDKQEDEG